MIKRKMQQPFLTANKSKQMIAKSLSYFFIQIYFYVNNILRITPDALQTTLKQLQIASQIYFHFFILKRTVLETQLLFQ